MKKQFMTNSFQMTLQKYEKTIGMTASVLATIMFISLIEVLISNFRGETNILIQPAATALNGLFWSLYGVSKKDLIIIIPNSIGLVFGILTVVAAII